MIRHKWSVWFILREVVFYTLLTVFGLVMVLPFFWALSTSFKPDKEIVTLPIQWFPHHYTFVHYVQAFTTVPFGRYFLNSLITAGCGVLTNLFLGSLAGYAFARLRFRGNTLLFRTLLTSMMVPGIVTMIPSFIILRSFPLAGGNNVLGSGGTGLLNTYWAVILPGAAGAFAVFMMRQFFLTLPAELGEAAKLDGCGEFRIFWRIYLPLCKPALATLGIFTFQAGWNAFLWPLIVLNDPKMATVQMGLQAFSYNHQTDFGPLMAASVVAVLPIMLVFIYAQRYMVQGITFAGTK
ncbi:MAG: carbohydrate ABC transporter permease [Alicyclobacillus sp.]|nr:carbohydrate ABC transporter permease [Alicyclobacillus sp.]